VTPPRNRDEFVPKHGRAQTAAPVEIDPETSEAYEAGEPRNSFRARRDTRERLAKMEAFKDHATSQLDEVKDTLGGVVDGMGALVREVSNLAGQFKGVADVITRQDNLALAERGAEIERTKLIVAAADKQAELKSASTRELIKQVGPWIVSIGAVITGILGILYGKGVL
jgi:hypothetical protein